LSDFGVVSLTVELRVAGATSEGSRPPARRLARFVLEAGVQYEIELNYRGFQARSIIIEADSNFEAREKTKVWAQAMVIPLEECWVTLKSPDGRSETFGPGEL